jgi:hypothetical protein
LRQLKKGKKKKKDLTLLVKIFAELPRTLDSDQ